MTEAGLALSLTTVALGDDLNMSSGEALNRLLVPLLPQPPSVSASPKPAPTAAPIRAMQFPSPVPGTMITQTGFGKVYSKASVASPRQRNRKREASPCRP